MFTQASHKALAILALQGLITSVFAKCGPPSFHLTLKPDLSPGGYKLHGCVLITDSFAANETLALIPTTIASVRTAQYGANDIVTLDDEGTISLVMQDVASGPAARPSSAHSPWGTCRRRTQARKLQTLLAHEMTHNWTP